MWNRHDLGEVRWSALCDYRRGFLAAGEMNGSPVLALVDEDGEVRPLSVFGSGTGLTSLATNGMEIRVSDGSGNVWWGEDWGVDRTEMLDRDGRTPDAFWATSSDEWMMGVGGFLNADAHLELRAFLFGYADGNPSLASATPLFLAAGCEPSSLQVTSTEGAIVVAGPVTSVPGGPVRPSLWAAGGPEDPDWVETPLENVPDAFTSTANWSTACWVAGHRAGIPVVHALNGTELSVPELALDREHPHVALLAVDDQGVRSLAVQGEHAAVILTRSAGDWEERTLPPGRLGGASLTPDRVWALLDGELWSTPS